MIASDPAWWIWWNSNGKTITKIHYYGLLQEPSRTLSCSNLINSSLSSASKDTVSVSSLVNSKSWVWYSFSNPIQKRIKILLIIPYQISKNTVILKKKFVVNFIKINTD